MYTAKRCAYRMGVLETPGGFGKSRRDEKEAESALPQPTYDSDLKHVCPYYQQGAWTLN